MKRIELLNLIIDENFKKGNYQFSLEVYYEDSNIGADIINFKVVEGRYWRRRLNDGDIEIVENTKPVLKEMENIKINKNKFNKKEIGG